MDVDSVKPSYEPPQPARREITIERFTDGGVTVTVPPRPSPSLRHELIWGTLWVTAGATMLWAAGARPSDLPSLVNRLIHPPPSAVLSLLVFTGPALCIAYVVRRLLIPDEPTIVGISPKSVFVQEQGYFFIRRFRAPRRALREIRIGRAERTSSKRPVCVVVEVAGHLSVSLCDRRTEREINEVAQALADAKQATLSNDAAQRAAVNAEMRGKSKSPRARF